MAEEIVLRGRDLSGAAFASVLRNFKQLESSAATLRSAMSTVLGGLTVRELASTFTSFTEGADAMGKLAQKAGISTSEMQQFALAGKLAGTNTEGLRTGLGILSRNMLDLRQGTGEATNVMGLLSKQTQDLLRNGAPTAKVLESLAEDFSGMEDGATKTAIAMKLLGRSGAELIPLLNGGASSLRAAREEAIRYGRVLSGEVIAAATEFNDNMTRVGEIARGVRDNIGVGLLPTFADLAQRMADTTVEGTKWQQVGENIAAGLKYVAEAGLYVYHVFDNITLSMGAMGAAAYELAHLRLRDAVDILNKAQLQLIENQKEFKSLLGDIKSLGKGFRDLTQAEEDYMLGVDARLRKPKDIVDAGALKKANDEFAASLRVAVAEQNRIWMAGEDERVKAGKDADAALTASLRQAVSEQQRIAMTEWEDVGKQRDARDRAFREEQDAQQKALADTTDYAREMGQVFTSSFLAIIQRGGSAREILQGLLGDIAAIVAKATIEKPVMNLIGAALSSIGGAFAGGATVYPSQWGSDFTVPGVSGTDSQFVPILASPGERIRVTPQSKSGGGDGGGNSFYVDMRGASVDAVARLEKLVSSVNASIERRAVNAVSDARSRGKMR